jgi:hypothetical protein
MAPAKGPTSFGFWVQQLTLPASLPAVRYGPTAAKSAYQFIRPGSVDLRVFRVERGVC